MRLLWISCVLVMLPAFSAREQKGELRLNARPADVAIFVDGQYAGRQRQFWLAPGEHRIRVVGRASRQESFSLHLADGETQIVLVDLPWPPPDQK